MTKISTDQKEKQLKVLNPSRLQVEMQYKALDDFLPSDHKARSIWDFVEKMDLSICFEEILTYKNSAGRPTTSPKVLLCLWIYSILDGNISARKIEELCQYHDVYKWIAGNTPINRTMLSDFRSKNAEKFNELLINCLAVMYQCDLLSDKDFAQDGTKVKASAGGNSLRRGCSLDAIKTDMEEYINFLEKELIRDPQAYDNRTKSAKMRGAKDRLQRIEKAVDTLEEIKKKRIL